MERDTVKTFLYGHLANVISNFKSYFPEVREKSEQLDWVRNPFTLSQSNRGMLPVYLKEGAIGPIHRPCVADYF